MKAAFTRTAHIVTSDVSHRVGLLARADGFC